LLFQRENSLVNARNAEINSQIEYNKALAALQQTTSTTLQANSITID
jgi:outer membrane protein TolC